MRDFSAAIVAWLVILLILSVVEYSALSNDLFHSYFFFVAQLPLYGLVIFGSYALCSIGYHLMVLEDSVDAHTELKAQIELARTELKRKGVKL